MWKKYLAFGSILCSCFLLNNMAFAQQTVFNVPNADVTPPGKIYVEQESQFRTWDPNKNWLGTEYLLVGVGHNTEVGTVLYNVSSPASHNISLAPGFKSAIPIFAKKLPNEELKVIVGSEIPISLQGGGTGNWSFSELSGRLPVVKTRLTGGISVGTSQIFGRNAVSFIGAVEQPLTKSLTGAVDWFSGTNSNGLLIPGVILALPKDTTFEVGYQIPNNSRCGNSGFVLELAKLF